MSDLTLTLATLKGSAEALRRAKNALDVASATVAQIQIETAKEQAATIAALQGLDNVGYYSSVDQLLRMERFAGKSASVDAIKANPQISEADAEAAWTAAAKAATGLNHLMVAPGSYSAIYRQQLQAAGKIADATYEAQRAWILATSKDEIMGL